MEETPPGCTTRERTVPCHQPQAGSSAPLPPSTNTARRAGCPCTAVTPPSFYSLTNTTPAAPRGSAAGDHPRQAWQVPGSAACGWDTSEMLFYRRLENTRYKVEMPQEQELVRKHQELHYFRLKRSLYLNCILPLHPHCPEPTQALCRHHLHRSPSLTRIAGCSSTNLFFLDGFFPQPLSIRFSQDTLSTSGLLKRSG